MNESGEAAAVPTGADASGKTEGRARFVSLDVRQSEPGRVAARAVLEWSRRSFVGEAEGESSAVGELRASASAVGQALGKVLGDDGAFHLVGIKDLHVFDHDVIAVLLHCPRLPDRRLIGLSLITHDRCHAAALAVLNATNRAVGTLVGS